MGVSMKMEELFKELKEGNENLQWLSKNFEKIRKQYSGKFVAIKDKKIILSSTDLEALIDKLEKRKEDPARLLIDFIPQEDFILVV